MPNPHLIPLAEGILIIHGDVTKDKDIPYVAGHAFSSRVDLASGETINIASAEGSTAVDLLIGSGNGPFNRLDLPTEGNVILTKDHKIKVKNILPGQRLAFAAKPEKDQGLVEISYTAR